MPKTLLLADDSVVIQKLVGLSFANEDVELITTDNGDDALTRAREVRPNLILADVVMPGKNGYEVCQAVKSDAALSHIPVLLLTGTFEAFDEDRARQVGSDGHITKPFEAQGLVDRVTDLLSRTPAAAPAPAPVTEPDLGLGTDSPLEVPVTEAPASSGDEAYDFFDDDASQDLAAPEPVAAAPIAASSLDLGNPDDAFEFGSDLDALDTTDSTSIGPDTLDTNFELDSDEPGDLPVAIIPGAQPAPPVQRPAPPPIPNDMNAPDATQVVLGETMIQEDFGAPPQAQVASLDANLGQPVPPPAAAPSAPPAVPVQEAGETVLADDLFAEPPVAAPPPPVAAPSPPVAAPPPPVAAPPPPVAAPPPPVAAPPQAPVLDISDTTEPSVPPAMDSGFEFGFEETAPAPAVPAAQGMEDLALDPGLDTSDPLAGIQPESPELLDFSAGEDLEARAPSLDDAADSTHGGYDVSASDLGDPLAVPVDDPAARVAPEVMASDIGLSAPQPSAGPDISAMMRDRIHETLEKIAWEAFADVSDSIVRQVLERVESVVWEVVPQMAEALIQEEIRRMKGDD